MRTDGPAGSALVQDCRQREATSQDRIRASATEERFRFSAATAAAPAAPVAVQKLRQSVYRGVALGASTWHNLRRALLADTTGKSAVVHSADRIPRVPLVFCAPGGSVVKGGNHGELPELAQLAMWCRELPPSTPIDRFAYPIYDSLRDESQAYEKHKKLNRYSVQDWSVHRISTELIAQGYGARHLWQDDGHAALILSRKLLDHAARLCNWTRRSVLVGSVRARRTTGIFACGRTAATTQGS